LPLRYYYDATSIDVTFAAYNAGHVDAATISADDIASFARLAVTSLLRRLWQSVHYARRRGVTLLFATPIYVLRYYFCAMLPLL